MSAFPSPLKSLELVMLHEVSTVPKLTTDWIAVPFMSQITRWPVEASCQRMSAFPSALKSLFTGDLGVAVGVTVGVAVGVGLAAIGVAVGVGLGIVGVGVGVTVGVGLGIVGVGVAAGVGLRSEEHTS